MSAIAAELVVRSSLLAALPGLAHGFTTRAAGSMAGSVHPNAEQLRNRAALESSLGLRVVKARQVHSADVVLVAGGTATRLRDGATSPLSSAMPVEGDALVTRERGLALAVAVADCVPVLVATPDGWVGAAHAGWEGATRGVVREMLRVLHERGAKLGRARAAIGPSIGPCCYEVDDARAAIVRERLGRRGERVLAPHGDRWLLDLWLTVRLQLADAGIDTVDALDICVKDDVSRFFSHRGEEGRAGRGLAFIGWTG